MIQLLILQDAPKTVETLLYIACGGLISALVYMYINGKSEIKEKDKTHALALEKQRADYLLQIKDKDDAISKITEEHRNDIKDGNKDYKYLVDKFSEYMNQIEKFTNASK